MAYNIKLVSGIQHNDSILVLICFHMAIFVLFIVLSLLKCSLEGSPLNQVFN